ncbi:MAG: metal ABC transporter permease [Verrucomicrobia bacterium]|nr:metal ABC transporter permease [Verrucomicrobiota bacterium]
MHQLSETLPVLALPFLACLTIAALHAYMGLHVLRRGVVFVDIALAQWAALGAAAALLLGPRLWPTELRAAGPPVAANEAALAAELEAEAQSGSAAAPLPAETVVEAHPHAAAERRFQYAMSLGFALLGAVLLSVGRFREEVVPHEAVIGILFVVAAALSVLVLSKAPHGHEKMEAMLIGSILFVSRRALLKMAILYAALGALHFALRRHFLAISENVEAAERAGYHVRRWDTLFFASFALMVTESVALAGVFVVFSYLIIPAACARLFAQSFRGQLFLAWAVALAITLLGLGVSAAADLPTGATLVAASGLAFLAAGSFRLVISAAVKQGAGER